MPRTLLITGSSGIAEATARLADRDGWQVFIAGREEDECRSLSGTLADSGYFVGDLRGESAARAAFEACLNRFQEIDAVFSAAGMSGRRFGDGPVHECTLDGWELTLAANARTAFLTSRCAIQYWLEARRPGSLVNLASVLAFAPEPAHFSTHAYAASKGAIIAMSRAMASHYASHGIRVNVLAPALVKTPMSARAQADPAIRGFIRDKQPLSQGFLAASDVAEAAMFLLGERSRHITGQVLTVDGGWTVTG
jgi:NAD(P)-dependent dehydrogenase (short-subunit alcohol dehydrogenase family)